MRAEFRFGDRNYKDGVFGEESSSVFSSLDQTKEPMKLNDPLLVGKFYLV